MRGGVTLQSRNRLVRTLVVLQFSLSVFLILGTSVLSSQIDYIRSSPLGFDKSHVLTFPSNSQGEEAAHELERFRNGLANRPEVIEVSGYSFPFGQSWLYIRLPEGEGTTVLIGEDVTGPAYSNANDSEVYFYTNWVDAHYLPTMGIDLVSGRNFSDEYPSDSEGAIIINETAAKRFGLDNPVGDKLPKGFSRADIIGVVNDFHYYPLHRAIDPLVLHMPRHDDLTSLFNIAVRIKSDNMPATLSLLESTWKKSSGGKPFDYRFLDTVVDQQYAGEQRWRHIARTAALLSVIITCLGLFGLASLAAARRTREVGIRKVLGATEGSIVGLISREFLLLALIGIAVAAPIGYLIMNRWLARFAYHTEIGWTAIALAGGLSLAVVVASVGFQAWKAARANPVDAIRYE